MIILKTQQQINCMRECGKIVAEILDLLKTKIKPGITTLELDRVADKCLKKNKAISAFKGYNGFPASICVSINHEVVHGIPRIDRVIKEADIVSVDVGVKKNGYCGDAAYTYSAGDISEEKKKLINVAEISLAKGIEQFTIGNRLYTLSHSIQQYVEKNGFSVVRDYVGHGIGRDLHEDPQVPNYGRIGTGPIFKTGMVLAIEPMVNMGTYKTKVLPDGWTVVTEDGLASAHFEHTIALTENGPEILTNG